MPRVYVINNETDLEIFSSDSHAKANEFIKNNDFHCVCLDRKPEVCLIYVEPNC